MWMFEEREPPVARASAVLLPPLPPLLPLPPFPPPLAFPPLAGDPKENEVGLPFVEGVEMEEAFFLSLALSLA